PITIYLIAGLFGERRRLWFAELPALLREAAGRRFEVDGEPIDLRPEAAADTEARLNDRLRRWPGDEAVAFIDRARAATGIGEAGDGQPFVDVEFVRRYARGDCVSFGSHTLDHQALAAQSDREVA